MTLGRGCAHNIQALCRLLDRTGSESLLLREVRWKATHGWISHAGARRYAHRLRRYSDLRRYRSESWYVHWREVDDVWAICRLFERDNMPCGLYVAKVAVTTGKGMPRAAARIRTSNAW